MVPQTKLTGQYGGIELLSALGFKLLVTALPDTILKVGGQGDDHAAATECKYDLSKHEDQKHASAYSSEIRRVIALIMESSSDATVLTSHQLPLQHMTDLFVLLTPHTVWDAVFEMHEPTLVYGSSEGIGGKSAWIDWFDGLTRHRDLLQERIRSWH